MVWFICKRNTLMLLHPGKEIATRLEALGITQKAFSSQIWKRVSEINELIKGKRNITLARDYVLSKYFHTELKYRIVKQIDYDYEQFLLLQSQKESKNIDSSGADFLWSDKQKQHRDDLENNGEKVDKKIDLSQDQTILDIVEKEKMKYLCLQEVFINF